MRRWSHLIVNLDRRILHRSSFFRPLDVAPDNLLSLSSSLSLFAVLHPLKSIPPILRATTSFSSSRDFIVHLSILIVLRIISNCNQNILLYWIFRREFTVRQSFTNTAPLFTHFLAKISPARSTQFYSEKVVKFLAPFLLLRPRSHCA